MEAGTAAAPPAGRAHLPGKCRGTWSRRTCSRAACSTFEPDTAYEVRFVMSDPDGLRGAASAATRRSRCARVPSRSRMRAAMSTTSIRRPIKGRSPSRRSTGSMCAYNYVCGGGDTTTTARPRVKAGDTILVHAGLYRYHPEFYGPDRTFNMTSPYEGTYYLTASGTPDKPIAIKAAGDGEVILRRQRQLQPVQRQGRQLQLLRGDDLPEHRASRSGPARSSSPDRKG